MKDVHPDNAVTRLNPPGEFHRGCFACGQNNADGLRMQFTRSGDKTCGTITIDGRFQGYNNIAQGGIVATLLDTAMVQLLHTLHGGNPLTGRLDIRYHAPTPLYTPLTVCASALGKRGDTCWAEAEILAGTTCCATAEGVFRLFND